MWLIVVFSLLIQLFGQDQEPSIVPVDNKRIIVIAILTQPSSNIEFPESEYSFIQESYIQYIESSGARVLVIDYNLPIEKQKELLRKTNGLLFMGGGAQIFVKNKDNNKQQEINPQNYKNKKKNQKKLKNKKSKKKTCNTELTLYGKISMELIKEAKEINKHDYFPVWGTCLGFEILLIQFSKKGSIIQLENILSPVSGMQNHNDFTTINQKSYPSRLLQYLGNENINLLQKQNVFKFNNQFGILTKNFFKYSNKSYQELYKHFKLLSYNFDDNGKKFVSMVEAKKYPFYGTQFHPEKTILQLNSLSQRDHFLMTQTNKSWFPLLLQFSNFFVQECQKSQTDNSQINHLIFGKKDNQNIIKIIQGEKFYFYKNKNSSEINLQNTSQKFNNKIEEKINVKHQKVQDCNDFNCVQPRNQLNLQLNNAQENQRYLNKQNLKKIQIESELHQQFL